MAERRPRQDRNELRRAEARIRESEARYRTLVESAPLPILVNSGEKIVYINPEAIRVLGGESADQFIGHDTFDIVHPDYRESAQQRVRRIYSKEADAVWREARFIRRDGREIEVEVAGQIIDYDGRPSAQIIFRDITEQKEAARARRRLEEQVRNAQKLESLGLLAGGIAHDFNNLLMGMLGNADLAQLDLPNTHPAQTCLGDIKTAARRAADLCKQLLAYAGMGRFRSEAVNLSALVREMTELLRVTVARAQLELVLAPDLPSVDADPSQMQQIIMNLLTNAADAVGGSGTITVATGVQSCDRTYLRSPYLNEDLPEGRYVYLEVSDNGCGMDGTTQHRLFDPFFTTKFVGRGLGLAAVLGIVRAHNGTIKVSSEPGRGSSFRVLLPASEHPVASQEGEGAIGESWRGSGTVLVVDDEAAVRDVATRLLSRLGFQVLAAQSGSEALALLEKASEEVRLVLLDLSMPRMNGEQAFSQLHAMAPDLPVILTSGYNETEMARRFTGQGLAGFLQKPYALEDLARKVRDVLG